MTFSEVVTGGCETTINCTVNQGNSTTTTTTTQTDGASPIRRAASGSTTTTTTTTTDSNYGAVGNAGSGVYAQAETAKNKANGTMLAALGMGAMLATMCNPPVNVTPCILAPIAVAAGILAGQKKGDAQRLMDSLGTDGSVDGTGGTTDTSVTTAGTADGTDGTAGTIAKIKADLAKKGYALNEDGSISTPGGTVAGDLNSQSLQAAGLNSGQISQLNSDLAKLKKDIAEQAENGVVVEEQNVAGNGLGGFNGGRTKLFGNEQEASVAALSDTDRTPVDRDPAAWTGYSTKFGDSSIGVPQSDIFLMVEKRVEDERKTMGH